MNSKSKKKLKDIQIKNFQKSQTDWPTIIKLLNWSIKREQFKPNEEYNIEFRIEKEKPGL